MKRKPWPSDLSQATVGHVHLKHLRCLHHKHPTPIKTYWGRAEDGRMTLKEAKDLIAKASPDQLTLEYLSGVSQCWRLAITSPEELVLGSTFGYRQTLGQIPQKDAEIGGESSPYHCLWNNGELIAYSIIGEIDLEASRKVISRGLIIAPPTHTQAFHGIEPVQGWLGDDPEDLLVKGDIHSWEVRQIGGKPYFLYPERCVQGIGTCRALSMQKFLESLRRYPKFVECIAQHHKGLWAQVLAGFQQENLVFP